MMKQTKYEAQAWAGSVLFHVFVFLAVAFCGGFAGVKAVEVSKPIDVVLYDADAAALPGKGGGGGGGGGSPAPLLEGSSPAEELVISESSTAADVVADDVPEAHVEGASASEAASKAVSGAVPGNVNRVEGGTGMGGTGTGSGGGNGSGTGTGNGSGIGPGSGSGSGGGNGSGHGRGNGDGDGDGGGLRPKVPPQLLEAVEPSYPERLRRQGVEGSVRVRILVGSDGAVESVEVIESSGYDELDAAAADAASGYRFEPAENVYGEPVRCAISTSIHFLLN